MRWTTTTSRRTHTKTKSFFKSLFKHPPLTTLNFFWEDDEFSRFYSTHYQKYSTLIVKKIVSGNLHLLLLISKANTHYLNPFLLNNKLPYLHYLDAFQTLSFSLVYILKFCKYISIAK